MKPFGGASGGCSSGKWQVATITIWKKQASAGSATKYAYGDKGSVEGISGDLKKKGLQGFLCCILQVIDHES